MTQRKRADASSHQPFFNREFCLLDVLHVVPNLYDYASVAILLKDNVIKYILIK